MSKKLTLAQLEQKLLEAEALLKEHDELMDFRDDDAKTPFVKNGERIRVSYNELQQYSLEERYEFAIDMINNSDFKIMSDDFKGVIALNILGFRSEAHASYKNIINMGVRNEFQFKIIELKSQINQRRINSAGGKKKTSRHKEYALKIAMDTWCEVPGASVPSLATKIFMHLNKKFTDVPEASTVESWLKKCDANPKVTPKVRNYELVIN